MAMSSTIRPVAPIAQYQLSFAAFVSMLAETYNAWKIERQTRAELLSLTDAELFDIGLSRDTVRTMDLTPRN